MTTVEDAERAIDLIGLEYPADIQATYNDLPTDYNGLIRLREHLYYLYEIGTETGNDDLADYALFANLHVRYRLLTFQNTLTPADAYYHRIYEQRLPLMKWRPYKEHSVSTTPQEDFVVEAQFATEVPVYSISSYEAERATLKPMVSTVQLETSQVVVVDSTPAEQVVVNPTPFVEPLVEVEDLTPIDVAPRLLAKDCSFSRVYLEYRTRLSSNLIIRSVDKHRITTVRLALHSMDEFNIFAVSYYGIPIRICCCDAARFARLFHHLTGRFAGYEDAGYYISASNRKRRGSLLSIALRQLSIAWLSSPPPPRC